MINVLRKVIPDEVSVGNLLQSQGTWFDFEPVDDHMECNNYIVAWDDGVIPRVASEDPARPLEYALCTAFWPPAPAGWKALDLLHSMFYIVPRYVHSTTAHHPAQRRSIHVHFPTAEYHSDHLA